MADAGRRDVGHDDAQRRARRRSARAHPARARHAHPPRHRARAGLRAREHRRVDRVLRAVAVLGRRADARGGARHQSQTRRGATSRITSGSASTAATSPSSTRIRRWRSSGCGRAGIRIGRVQLSSALHVHFPDDAHGRGATSPAALRPFADTTYLHQVVEQQDDGLRHYPDLDVALADEARVRRPSGASTSTCRSSPASTRRSARRRTTSARSSTLALQTTIHARTSRSRPTPGTSCPPGLKMDLGESIAREYEWVLQTIAIDASSTRSTPVADTSIAMQ